jgi:hypothetical protein
MEAAFRTFPTWPSIEKSPDDPLKSLIIFSPVISYCAALTYNSLGTFVPDNCLSFDFHEAWKDYTGRAVGLAG